MKHLEEHQIQGNRTSDDVLMYYTTIGWMMWNWMVKINLEKNIYNFRFRNLNLFFVKFLQVSALALGTSLVLYDGSPLHPQPDSMWDLVDECGITVFGTSAKWIAVQEDRMVCNCCYFRIDFTKIMLIYEMNLIIEMTYQNFFP